MILGTGVDIVDIDRIAESVRVFGQRFINRILTAKELESFGTVDNSRRFVSFLAKRFASKEAMAKAIGCGIGKHCGFKDIIILNYPLGKPLIEKTPAILSTFSSLLGIQDARIHLTISDEKRYAVAYVIIESS